MLVILETVARLPLEDYEGLLGIVQGKAPLSHGLNGAYVERTTTLVEKVRDHRLCKTGDDGLTRWSEVGITTLEEVTN